MYFNYDGIDSRHFGIAAVDIGGGMYDEMFMPSRTVEETITEKRVTPIFHGVKLEKRSFDLNLAFENGFNDDLIDGVIEWLFKDEYKPLYFDGNPNKIMFSMISGKSSLIHNGLEEGYLTVSVETNSPYKYSREKTESFSSKSPIFINNGGHKDVFPKYTIRKIGSGDLKIKLNDNNVLITNLEGGEVLNIDSMRGIIETSIPGIYRYNNIKAGELEHLYLAKGVSKIEIDGESEIDMSYREIYGF